VLAKTGTPGNRRWPWWGTWPWTPVLLGIGPCHVAQDSPDLWAFRIHVFSCWPTSVLLLPPLLGATSISLTPLDFSPLPVLSHVALCHPLRSLKFISRLQMREQFPLSDTMRAVKSLLKSRLVLSDTRVCQALAAPPDGPEDLHSLRGRVTGSCRPLELAVFVATPESTQELDFNKIISAFSCIFPLLFLQAELRYSAEGEKNF